MTEDFMVIDFRRRSCNKNPPQASFDYPDAFDPSIPQYDETNIYQPMKGILTIVHSPDEYPLSHGHHVHLMYWTENTFHFYPEMFLMDDAIKAWPLQKRNCCLDGERNLIFFKIYTKHNCKHECLSLLMLEKCKCVPFYMIRKDIFF